jgi:hypothetical protein
MLSIIGLMLMKIHFSIIYTYAKLLCSQFPTHDKSVDLLGYLYISPCQVSHTLDNKVTREEHKRRGHTHTPLWIIMLFLLDNTGCILLKDL